MNWGNAIVRSREYTSSNVITSLVLDLHLEGDFQKTKKKVTWLAAPTPNHPLTDVVLLDYDYLITKKKLEEQDSLADYITPVTEFKREAFADASVRGLKKGDIIQFERKGYYILDGEDSGRLAFVRIPDGKASGLASKAGVAAGE